MQSITAMEPRVIAARKHNENYAELQKQIDELRAMIEAGKEPAKKAKAKSAEDDKE